MVRATFPGNCIDSAQDTFAIAHETRCWHVQLCCETIIGWPRATAAPLNGFAFRSQM
jgi:hypothetical protein